MANNGQPELRDPVTVDVSPYARAQTFEGWGTSLAWWANVLGGWSEERQQEIVDKLYSAEQGLGMTIARYNIGGTKDANDPYLDYGKAILSYQSEDGSWDWSRDANQRAILQKIQTTADSPIFEAFSNCPPWWMTCSYDPSSPDGAAGCTTGGPNGGDNLRDGSEGDFARYLVDVLRHFRDEWNIVFRTLAPFNEPVAGWWKYRITKQEGAQILARQQELVLREAFDALRNAGLHETSLSASDESFVEMARATWEAFSDETKARIPQVNTHTYNDFSYDPTAFRQAVHADGKKLWMSEVGFENGEHPVPDSRSMSGALKLARGVAKDLKTMQAEAWVYWQAVESDVSTWGLIFAPFEHNEKESYRMYKQYYALANYSRFIRPGSAVVDVQGECSLAAVSADADRLVIVTYNESETEPAMHRYRLRDLPDPAFCGKVRVYRTSADENLAKLEPIALQDGTFTAEVPPASVTTYVIEGLPR
ncbi:glycoside hydrolase [Saccharibacillus sp. O23]|uniref:glycoside hydrolase n=1 Tax=Saccharibacillus sp. O23 TaxID=2009338 RepID=UPI0015C6273E|nr:glycoside hydrolase [Saccharibacillus sp. O23]